MAYYVGRDVDVFWGTEHETHGIKENSTDFELEVEALAGSGSSADTIVGSLADVGESFTKLTDVTGVDLSIGSQDEDITYMGLRNVGKIEIKKDTSITITMKKKDRKFLQLYQGSVDSSSAEDTVGGHTARWGLTELTNGAFKIQGGDIDPKSCVDADDSTVTTYGYRLIIEFKGDKTGQTGDGAAVCIPNCTISEVTHTTSNEAADEESVTFTSQVKPFISNARMNAATVSGSTAPFHISLTTQTPLTEV